MTNYEWMVKRFLMDIDTPEKMAKLMTAGFKFGELEEIIGGLFCDPDAVGCSDEDKLNAMSYIAPCEECAKRWLGQEH